MFNMPASNIYKFGAIGVYTEKTLRTFELYLSDLFKGNSFASARLLNIDDISVRQDIHRTKPNQLIRASLFQSILKK